MKLAVQLLILIGIFIVPSYGVVCGNVQIKQVLSGHALMVECQMGDVTCLMPVRLRYIKAPEPGNCEDAEAIAGARAKLEEWVNKEPAFVLWSPEEKWSYDEYGRLMAVIFDAESFKVANNAPPAALQDNVVTAGFAILTTEHGEIPLDFGLRNSITLGERFAETRKWGLWQNPPDFFGKKEPVKK